MAEDSALRNNAETTGAEENSAKAGLDKNFTVNFNEPLPQLTTEFAKAFAASARKPRMRDSGGANAPALRPGV